MDALFNDLLHDRVLQGAYWKDGELHKVQEFHFFLSQEDADVYMQSTHIVLYKTTLLQIVDGKLIFLRNGEEIRNVRGSLTTSFACRVIGQPDVLYIRDCSQPGRRYPADYFVDYDANPNERERIINDRGFPVDGNGDVKGSSEVERAVTAERLNFLAATLLMLVLGGAIAYICFMFTTAEDVPPIMIVGLSATFAWFFSVIAADITAKDRLMRSFTYGVSAFAGASMMYFTLPVVHQGVETFSIGLISAFVTACVGILLMVAMAIFGKADRILNER